MDKSKRTQLEEWYKEEMSDSMKYRQAAGEYPQYGPMLCDMADEEMWHAKHIRFMLEHD